MLAKDILRIDRYRLIRFWINSETRKGKPQKWVEIGHFFQGFDFKLTRIRETDGLARERPIAFRASGTFEPAQNHMEDYAQYLSLMNGARGVAMLFGNRAYSTQGTLLILDWNGEIDGRISIVADAPLYSGMLKAGGNLSGYVPIYRLYTVTNLALQNGALNYTKTGSLFIESTGDPGKLSDTGNTIGI